MALSEQKLRELAEIEPPRFLERIADFLADLTLRSSPIAVLERVQAGGAEPIGNTGLAAESFGAQISRRAAFSGVADPSSMLYRMLRPYQVGPQELREFTLWLVKYHDKYAETEVLREPPQAARAEAQASVARQAGTEDRALPPRRVRAEATEMLEEEPLPGRKRVRVVRRVSTGVTETTTYEESAVPPRLGGPSEPRAPAVAAGARQTAEPPREPDVLSRAWRAGHRTPSGAAVPSELELAPPTARRTATRALWMSNLVLASTAAGMMMGRSLAPASLAGRLMAPSALGVAGPATLASGFMPPSFAYPLSHPPVSTASWLGVAPPAPYPADFVPMPGAPLPVERLGVPHPAYEPAAVQLPEPMASRLPIEPGRTAFESHESARALLGAAPADQLSRLPTRPGLELADTHELSSHLPSSEGRPYPRPAPRRSASPIPGLLAAGLAGFLIGRLTTGHAPKGISSTPAVELFVQPISSPGRVPRVRIFSPNFPGSLEAVVVDASGGVPAVPLAPQTTSAPPSGRRGMATSPRTLPALHDILGFSTMAAGSRTPSAAQPRPVPVHPRLGEMTLVAPPLAVASEQAEQRGSAVAFDWAALAKAAGPLDRSGWERLSQVLPAGTQAIYPAMPSQELPPGAVNLRLAPSVLRPLLAQAYGSHAAGIAGSAAAMAASGAGAPPGGVPMPARILPVKRPMGAVESVLPSPTPSVAGALEEAGAGQARRSPMLDFLGVPVRLAPSLGGRAELRDELAARGIAAQGAQPQVVRPHVFTPLRQHVFPAMQTVQAEPDRAAWRKAAPHFGLRDAEPTTILAPDARVKPLTPASPVPQLHTVEPRPALRPWLAQSIADRNAGIRPASPPLLATGRTFPTAPMRLTPAGGAEPSPEWPALRTGPAPDVGQAGHFRAPASVPLATLRLPSFPEAASGHGRPIGQLDPAVAPHATGPMPPEQLSVPLPSRVATHAPLVVPMRGARHAGETPEPSLQSRGALRSFEVPLAGTPPLPDMARPALSAPRLPHFAGDTPVGAHFAPVLERLSVPRFAGPTPSGSGDLRGGFRPSSAEGVRPVTTRTLVTPLPFAVPTLAPVPVPILGRVVTATSLAGTATADRSGRRAQPPAGPPPPIPASMVLPIAGGGAELPPALPSSLFAPVTSAMTPLAPLRPATPPMPRVPMTLPGVPAPTEELPSPRTTATIVERAPTRYYASVDAGPARRVIVQRAASEAAGTVGGPHQPLPSAHLAKRFPADQQRASVLTSREDGMTANEVYLLANDVWSILKQRLKWEADRRGRW